MIWRCCRTVEGSAAPSRLATQTSEGSHAPTANSCGVSLRSFCLPAGCSTLSHVVPELRLLRRCAALALATGRCSSSGLSWALCLCRALSLLRIGSSSASEPPLRVKPPYGGGEGVCLYSLDLEDPGPRLGLGLCQKPGNVDGLPEKHDSTMKMKNFGLLPGKSYQKPGVFGPQLEKHIKNLVFLKVRTRNCVRGRSFQSAERSTSIGVSISSKRWGARFARFARPCPAVPGYPSHGLPPRTSQPHVPESR